MEKKINITELLKDCPKGMELDCTICNGVKFIELDRNPNFPIVVRANNGYEFTLTKYGQIHNIDDAKCVIYPKGKITWEGFQRPIVDGEILSNGICICIYNGNENDQYYGCYVGVGHISNSNYFINQPQNSYFTKKNSRLATEEEKQKLFDAIKNNGYKWDNETKTLVKLLKFKVGDRIRHKNSSVYCTLGEYSEGISAYRTDIGLSLTYKDLEQWELLPAKFDINTLKPFKSEVLIRDTNIQAWTGAFYSHYDVKDDYPYHCINFGRYKQCIPYEGNEHLLGKTNDCDDYYKTWK